MTSQPTFAPPQEVRTSFLLWIIGIVIGAVSTLSVFLILDDVLAAAAAERPPELTPEQFRTAAMVGIVVFAVLYLIALALVALFAFKMRSGRNWARIVLTVLGAIGILLNLGGLFGGGSAGGGNVVDLILPIVQLVLLGAAIFLMYRPAANAYFAPR